MRRFFVALIAAFTFVAAPLAVHAKDNVYQSFFGSAISGTDPVAYFTEGRPVEGSSDFKHDWNGATWRFASAENRDLFAASPEKYAPQYGGFCAFGVTMNKKFDTDPTAWHIRGDKLYLNLNKDVQKKWVTDIPGYIETAQTNWVDIKGLTEEQIEKVYD